MRNFANMFIECAHCAFLTLTSKGLTIHLRRRHGIIAHNRPPRRKTMRAPPIRLANCSMRREAWMEPFGCAYCSYRTALSVKLRQHFDIIHKQAWASMGRNSLGGTERAVSRGLHLSTGNARAPYPTPSSSSISAGSGSQHVTALPVDAGPTTVSGITSTMHAAEPLYGHTGQILGWKRPTKVTSMPPQMTTEWSMVYQQQKISHPTAQSQAVRSQQHSARDGSVHLEQE
ncbi:hypothetical protein BIW11_00731 [Tropilaelaps mercedesae]|uniref:C2H2-type domain-containing protein n=1 Tax=Tropilaelaps mercedesae TaxID=418985 RepID=A0A1V9XQJ1_9ACAR|nr:hypothetical protein BIW11_00731 [Tropilaelaps mercedesae]